MAVVEPRIQKKLGMLMNVLLIGGHTTNPTGSGGAASTENANLVECVCAAGRSLRWVV
jgi:hypothetical protein